MRDVDLASGFCFAADDLRASRSGRSAAPRGAACRRRCHRGPARAAAAGSCRCRRRRPREITARSSTLVNSAILRRCSSGNGCEQRHSRMSGWMPMPRSSLTECCVGLVLISPEPPTIGTSVRCMYSTLVAPELDAHLADRLEERQRLDVADRAADLDHADVGIAGAQHDAALDLIGDVRDHLHGRAQVVAAALLGDHALVDAPGGEIAVAARRRMRRSARSVPGPGRSRCRRR